LTLSIRRVVTGHDSTGRSVVVSDGIVPDVVSERPGQERSLLWAARGLPADNDGSGDGALPGFLGGSGEGSVFGIVKLDPGIASRPHRTVSIDFGVVLSGRLGLRLAEGDVYFDAGDVFVQRGTVRDWINPGRRPCVMAVVMITAEPLRIGDEVLGPIP
jgi:hypothetical protein